MKDPEVMPPEEENSLNRAIANNIKFQVSKQLEEQVGAKMAEEYARLQQEEHQRVQAYTRKWEDHLEKVQRDKDVERQ